MSRPAGLAERMGAYAKWFGASFAAVYGPFLAVGVVLGACLLAVRLGGAPLPYPRPSSLFFHAVALPPVPPPPPPPPQPPLKEYVAEGPVDREVKPGEIVALHPDGEAEATLVDAKTQVQRTERTTTARHLAVVFAFDDSGSMYGGGSGGNDGGDKRYEDVLRLLAKLDKEDRVCITRTETDPVYASGWISPAEAADIIRTVRREKTRDGSGGLRVDPTDFPHQGSDLYSAISGSLGQVDAADYRRTLLFLGDGDATNFGYQRPSTLDGLKSEEFTMSGVIFGKDAAGALNPSGQNHFLVDDAKSTGGEVRAAGDVSEVDALLRAMLEKSKRSLKVAYTLRVTLKTRQPLRKGDRVRVDTPSGSYTLRVP